jgi:hypothetical protein
MKIPWRPPFRAILSHSFYARQGKKLQGPR